MAQLSDEELARLARDGSADAFAAIVRRLTGRLHGYLLGRCRNVQDAEDLVQETFLKSLANLRRYRPGQLFAPWLFTIATRLAASHYRRRRPAADVADMEIADARSVHPATEMLATERKDDLWALARRLLSDDQFTAVWLRYAEDMPVRHVAGVMGKTQIGVRVLLHRSRRKLLEARGTPVPTVCGMGPYGQAVSPMSSSGKQQQQQQQDTAEMPVPRTKGTPCGAERVVG